MVPRCRKDVANVNDPAKIVLRLFYKICSVADNCWSAADGKTSGSNHLCDGGSDTSLTEHPVHLQVVVGPPGSVCNGYRGDGPGVLR